MIRHETTFATMTCSSILDARPLRCVMLQWYGIVVWYGIVSYCSPAPYRNAICNDLQQWYLHQGACLSSLSSAQRMATSRRVGLSARFGRHVFQSSPVKSSIAPGGSTKENKKTIMGRFVSRSSSMLCHAMPCHTIPQFLSIYAEADSSRGGGDLSPG